MPFNYNFQTDDDLISQKWNDSKIGNSTKIPVKNSKNQNSINSSNSQVFQTSEKFNFPKNFQTTIRKAQNSDAEIIVQINKNSWLKTYPNTEFGITEADILALNWEKNLEKKQKTIENVANLWLLEISLENSEISSGNLNFGELKSENESANSQKNFTENLGKNQTLENKIETKTENENEQIGENSNQKKVVGFVRFFKNEEDLNEIKAIYVEPIFVGLGFGTDLMIFAIEKLGFEQNWTVKVASYNQNAIEFYQKFGFKITKKCENYQLTGEKSIPLIQMIANKKKLQKKIAEMKFKLKDKLESLEIQNSQNLEKSRDLENNSGNGLENGLQNQETWTILTPPPNLTGNLHAGHALEHFIMDSLSRRKRQIGKNVLYYPGIDHAGIQLEGVISKLIGNGEFDQQIKESFENLTEISPLKIQIRKTKNSDAEKILEINKNSWIATYPSNEFGITKAEIENINWQNKIEKIRQNLETENVNNYVLEIIENENNSQKWQIVGYVSFFKNQENFSEVKAIYFDPKFVGRGFGTDLMIFAIEELGFERDFEIKVASYNHNAIQFYQKFGFEKTGINEEFQLLKAKKIIEIQMIAKKEIIKTKIEQIKKQKTEKIDKFSQFQSQKTEDRANWLKKSYPELWLECAWSKVNLWRDNQKNQSLILGDSPDWNKQLFTLDERAVDMVNLAFENYWRDGLIYRDSYLINWSVALQTALSDVPEDIGRMEKVDHFVTFIYQIAEIKINIEKNLKNQEKNKTENEILVKLLKLKNLQILVSTVRIETVFADVAVAIHPQKLAELFGFEKSEIEILKNWLNSGKVEIIVEIPPLKVKNVKLIIDETVDLEFGTGCLKITPAHDLVDYNIAKKHNFTSFSQAIGRDGKLTEICGEFSGLTVEKARTLILKRLLETGFIPQKNLKN